VIQIGVHPTGEEPNQHIVHLASRVSRMKTICEVPTMLKLGPCSRDEVLALAIVRPCHRRGLPHSPSNKPPRSREVRFDKIVTMLLGLSDPTNQTCGQYKSKLVHRGQNDVILNRHRQGLPSWNLRIATTLSPPFPSE
jgi:hypothetical protein